MRFAAISDIHGNSWALEAVLYHIERRGIANIVNLGDSFSGPLDAAGTARLLVERDIFSIMGNHDRYLIEVAKEDMHEWEADCAEAILPRYEDWIRALPAKAVWNDIAFICHATPHDDNLYWRETVSGNGHVIARPFDEMAALAEGIREKIILAGHSHLSGATRLGEGRLLVNPGSVGCPAYDDDRPFYHRVEAGTPHARYAEFEIDGETVNVSSHAVAYDVDAAVQSALKRNRNDWAFALANGRLL